MSVGELSVLPAAIDLAGSEVHLVGRVGREHAVGRALDPVKDGYDVVLLDCPPSLGILTINGLTAADFVLVPLQCETLSHRGVGQLLETVADVRAYTQPDLGVLGAVATMFDGRTRHTREVLADVETRYGLPVLAPMIPRSVRFAEAPATGQSILGHAPSSIGAVAYRELAETVTRCWRRDRSTIRVEHGRDPEGRREARAVLERGAATRARSSSSARGATAGRASATQSSRNATCRTGSGPRGGTTPAT